jgi:hypothetical protein
MSFSWTFDPGAQILRAPSGLTISVREVAQMLADRRNCRYDFAGEWSGWKMRGNKLIPPFSGRNAPKLTPQSAKMFLVWVNEPAIEFAHRKPVAGRPNLRLVYTRSR